MSRIQLSSKSTSQENGGSIEGFNVVDIERNITRTYKERGFMEKI